MIGQRFGKLVVIDVERVNNHTSYICKCDCGCEHKVFSGNLKRTSSCGCNYHGMSDTTEYKIWDGMKQRCLNPKATGYEYYGGRGITICERWLKFSNFYKDMGDRPATNLTLSRMDNNKGYSPDNCGWDTWDYQNNNKRQRSKQQ